MSFHISAGDATLAHGHARWLADILPMQLFVQQAKLISRKDKVSARQVDRLIPDSLKKYLIFRHVIKPNGDRAKAAWIFLAPMQDFLSVIEAILRKGVFLVVECGIRVSNHLMARLMTRTSNSSDLNVNLKFLESHIVAVMQSMDSLDGMYGNFKGFSSGTSYDSSGKIIWGIESGNVIGKTWVGAETFHQDDKKNIESMDANCDIKIIWEE